MTDWIKRFYDGLQAYIAKKGESPWWAIYNRAAEMIKNPRPADEQVLEAIIEGLSPEEHELCEQIFGNGKTTDDLAKESGISRQTWGVRLMNARERVCACIGFYTELGMYVMPGKTIVNDFHNAMKTAGVRTMRNRKDTMFDRCYFSKLTTYGRHSCRALHEPYCESEGKCKFFKPLDYKPKFKDGYVQLKTHNERKGLRL